MNHFTDAVYNSREFNERFRYDGKDLGAHCKEGRTTFKVWSPFAENVRLCLYQDGISKVWREQELVPGEKGVWSAVLEEDLHGIYYDYVVKRDGEEVRTADPYAAGCGCNGERSMVVDLGRTNPPGFEEDAAPKLQEEQIIYELHIKDFSYDVQSGVPEEYRGKYKAFTINTTDREYPTCMEYLRSLGVTHVQLLPFFDYGSVDESGDKKQYNWGYDPVNYNVPEGSYATDVTDGTVRIRECKEMIQAFHANGLRVVMDVVYNHTYRKDSWLERMVPGYYYRHLEDGSLSDGSACGNDIAAGRAMVDNYIADSVMYWAKEYHIDGFRFDLMGLLTVELMNRIRRELDEEFGPGEKILYGEPWSADSSPMEEGTRAALKENTCYLDEGIGIFCDDTRDLIKGDAFEEKEPGAVNGARGLEPLLLRAVTGWKNGGADFVPVSCSQIINYVSAHDNFTLWDKLVLSMRDTPDFHKKDEGVLAANKLAAFICFTCQGRLFLQAGEEFGRTKLGEGNSYCSAPELNMLDWHRTVEFAELVDYYKGLMRLRRYLPGLCDKSASAAERVSDRQIHEDGVVSFRVDNRDSQGGGDWEELCIVYNTAGQDYFLALPEGAWEILADGREADCRKDAGSCGEGAFSEDAGSGSMAAKNRGKSAEKKKGVRVDAHSGMLLGRKAGCV